MFSNSVILTILEFQQSKKVLFFSPSKPGGRWPLQAQQQAAGVESLPEKVSDWTCGGTYFGTRDIYFDRLDIYFDTLDIYFDTLNTYFDALDIF